MMWSAVFVLVLTQTLQDPAHRAVPPADHDDHVLHVPEHPQASLGPPVSQVVNLPGVEKVEELPVELGSLSAS